MANEFDSERVIGLVSAAGTENKRVIELLRDWLGRAGYESHIVKISGEIIPLLREVPNYGYDAFARLSGLMDAGNSARADSENDAILAYGAVAAIASKRTKSRGNVVETSKTAHIIDSLKRPEEVAHLRVVYPSGFVLVGIHAADQLRQKQLVERGMEIGLAQRLIQRDRDEGEVPHGQRVNQTFHLADFFVRESDSQAQIKSAVRTRLQTQSLNLRIMRWVMAA